MVRSNPFRIAIMAPLFLAATGALAADENRAGEAELAELLEGRIAGDPVECLPDSRRDTMQAIDGTAFVFASATLST